MSGHSKWSTIKHKKAALDSKRGKVFSQISRLIRIAVKEGKSGDPNQNMSLRLPLEKARQANMPKDNIQRAIDRGLGHSANGAKLDEVVYEGYGPGGVGLLVMAVTDNRNRTSAEIRNILDKAGGSLGGPGSAAYLFEIHPDGQADIKIPMPLSDENDKIKLDTLMEELEALDEVEMVVSNVAETEAN